jgi:hypothetical protein
LVINDVIGRYWRLFGQLQEVLAEEKDRVQTRQILAEVLGEVTVGRDRETGEVFADLEEPAERLLITAVGESLGLVAGAGFEPTTFGL